MYVSREIHKIIIHHLCEIRDSKNVKMILDISVYGTCYLIARLEYLKDVTLLKKKVLLVFEILLKLLFIVIGFLFSITGSHYDADGQYHEHSFWPRVIEEKYDGFSTCLLMKADNLNKDNYVNVRKFYIYFALRK